MRAGAGASVRAREPRGEGLVVLEAVELPGPEVARGHRGPDDDLDDRRREPVDADDTGHEKVVQRRADERHASSRAACAPAAVSRASSSSAKSSRILGAPSRAEAIAFTTEPA